MFCPVKSSTAWKSLVQRVGEEQAYAVWAEFEGQIDDNGNPATVPLLGEKELKRTAEMLGISYEDVQFAAGLYRQGYFAQFQDDVLILDETAPSGSAYYAAFRRVFQQRINTGRKNIVYDEVRSLLGDTELTTGTIEELLAEEYVKWKQTGESTLIPKKNTVQGVFETIVSTVKSVLRLGSKTLMLVYMICPT
jgi:hypothetical protein